MSDTIQKLYLEIQGHLMEDEVPSDYLESIYDNPVFSQEPFRSLHLLKTTEQHPTHHPEGNVWNHTMLVVDEAARVREKSKNPRVFMWAALLHDIGKPVTTRQKSGKITAYDHDKVGAKLVTAFLNYFETDQNFIRQVSMLVRYHMQILFVVKKMPFADIKGMKRDTDVEEVALLGLCDRMGRGKKNQKEEENNIKSFLKMVGVQHAL